MIYLPPQFDQRDPENVDRLIRENPFATLISVHEGAPLVSHFPIIPCEGSAASRKLEGHLATRNPHASHLKDGDRVVVIFHGPHTYVTPKWYAENDVPTWNYAVVHVSGKLRWVREFKPLVQLLLRMTVVFEGKNGDSWSFFLPDDLKKPEELLGAIVGFEIEVDSVQAKYKLNQNRSEADRASVIRGLKSRTDEMSHQIAKMMEHQY